MILLEDLSKPKTVNISSMLQGLHFNNVHIMGDSNGYHLCYLPYNISDKFIVHADNILYKKLILSLSECSNSQEIANNISRYDESQQQKPMRLLRRYVNSSTTLTLNFYMVLAQTLIASSPEINFNKRGKAMFQIAKKNRSLIQMGELFTMIYEKLDKTILDLSSNTFIDSLWKVYCDNDVDISNDLFIITPPSKMRKNGRTFLEEELMFEVIDYIQNKGGKFILIDELSFGKKLNIVLEANAKWKNRKSKLIDYVNSQTIILTNLV